MKKYAIKRILQLIPILFAITFLSYGMMRIAGSDVVTRKMENTGGVVSEAALDAAREELGLDKPFLTQYRTHQNHQYFLLNKHIQLPDYREYLPLSIIAPYYQSYDCQ